MLPEGMAAMEPMRESVTIPESTSITTRAIQSSGSLVIRSRRCRRGSRAWRPYSKAGERLPFAAPLCLRPPRIAQAQGFPPPMNIHEYQAKELLSKFGVAVPAGIAAISVEEAGPATGHLTGPLYVVKATNHSGGAGTVNITEFGPAAKGGVSTTRRRGERREATTVL